MNEWLFASRVFGLLTFEVGRHFSSFLRKRCTSNWSENVLHITKATQDRQFSWSIGLGVRVRLWVKFLNDACMCLGSEKVKSWTYHSETKIRKPNPLLTCDEVGTLWGVLAIHRQYSFRPVKTKKKKRFFWSMKTYLSHFWKFWISHFSP